MQVDRYQSTSENTRPPADDVGVSTAWVQSFESGPIDVSVCIANWNCRDHLRACLTSLQDHPQGVRLETIVVDNASTDGAPDMVAREFPEVVLIRNDANAGFARASNQAADRASGKYLFFLNNDTVVPAYTLRRLVSYAKRHPAAGMIGPRLRDQYGRLQISCRRRPRLASMLHRTSLFSWTRLFKREYENYRRKHFDPDHEQSVQVLMGAAVLMPRAVYEDCGRWDEDYRFGVEDIDLSVRVGQKYDVIYWPHVEIVHLGRLSSRANVAFTAPNLLVGYAHFFRKSGSSRLALIAYKLAMTVDAPLRLAIKSTQYLFRRILGRREQAERNLQAVRGLWNFLRHEMGRFWRT